MSKSRMFGRTADVMPVQPSICSQVHSEAGVVLYSATLHR